jgi:hypothetical protein
MLDQLLSPYAVKVRWCTIPAGRFRWDIHRNDRPALSSPESFATRQEAEANGRAGVERLVSTGREDK